MHTIGLVGAKNGVGTTVTAAMLFLRLQELDYMVKFAAGHDGYAALGLPYDGENWIHGKNVDDSTPESKRILILDNSYGDQTLIVTTGCYMALSRAVTNDLCSNPTVAGIVHIAQFGRALTEHDISRALGKPILGTIPYDPAISRCVDAGLLAARMPSVARQPIASIVDSLLYAPVEAADA